METQVSAQMCDRCAMFFEDDDMAVLRNGRSPRLCLRCEAQCRSEAKNYRTAEKRWCRTCHAILDTKSFYPSALPEAHPACSTCTAQRAKDKASTVAVKRLEVRPKESVSALFSVLELAISELTAVDRQRLVRMLLAYFDAQPG